MMDIASSPFHFILKHKGPKATLQALVTRGMVDVGFAQKDSFIYAMSKSPDKYVDGKLVEKGESQPIVMLTPAGWTLLATLDLGVK